jgi:hypothetical protein
MRPVGALLATVVHRAKITTGCSAGSVPSRGSLAGRGCHDGSRHQMSNPSWHVLVHGGFVGGSRLQGDVTAPAGWTRRDHEVVSLHDQHVVKAQMQV